MKAVLVLIMASTVFASEKSFDGYQTLDAHQFGDLHKAVKNSGLKFKANCTNQYGEKFAATDTRFTDCMNESVVRTRHNQVPGAQENLSFGTEL